MCYGIKKCYIKIPQSMERLVFSVRTLVTTSIAVRLYGLSSNHSRETLTITRDKSIRENYLRAINKLEVGYA